MPVDQNEQKVFWAKTKGRRTPDHPAVVAFAEPKVDFIRRCIENDAGSGEIKRILDVGCGNGFFTRPLAKWANCTALDFSERMLELNPVDVTKVCGDVLDMPFSDNNFDVVFCSNLLHHVSDPLKAIVEMKRVSSRYVVLSEPNRNNPLMFGFSFLKPEERGALKFSCDYMAGLVEQAGLKPLCVKTMGAIVPNKTPLSLLPFLKRVDGKYPMGFYSVVISR